MKEPTQYSIEEILTKLWCAVDIEDVDEGLIDVGAIDDAEQAINQLIYTQVLELIPKDIYAPTDFGKGKNEAYMELRNKAKAKYIGQPK